MLISTSVKSSLVTSKYNFMTPTVIYYLTAPIRSIIFNFNNFAAEPDVDRFLADPTMLWCNCDKPPFAEKDYCHVLTVDLRTIKNIKLRKVNCRGPKYRENKASILVRLQRVFFMAEINAYLSAVTRNVYLKNLSQNGSIW